MLKAALLCSAVCTAFVVVAPASSAFAEAPVPDSRNHSLTVKLGKVKGKKCLMTRQGDLWVLNFHRKTKAKHQVLDAIGIDYLSLTDANSTVLLPFSAIAHIYIDEK